MFSGVIPRPQDSLRSKLWYLTFHQFMYSSKLWVVVRMKLRRARGSRGLAPAILPRTMFSGAAPQTPWDRFARGNGNVYSSCSQTPANLTLLVVFLGTHPQEHNKLSNWIFLFRKWSKSVVLLRNILGVYRKLGEAGPGDMGVTRNTMDFSV